MRPAQIGQTTHSATTQGVKPMLLLWKRSSMSISRSHLLCAVKLLKFEGAMYCSKDLTGTTLGRLSEYEAPLSMII